MLMFKIYLVCAVMITFTALDSTAQDSLYIHTVMPSGVDTNADYQVEVSTSAIRDTFYLSSVTVQFLIPNFSTINSNEPFTLTADTTALSPTLNATYFRFYSTKNFLTFNISF